MLKVLCGSRPGPASIIRTQEVLDFSHSFGKAMFSGRHRVWVLVFGPSTQEVSIWLEMWTLTWLWLKKVVPKWHLGKWNQRLKPA